MINAERAREMVQNCIESTGNLYIAEIEELITNAAKAGKYYVTYKPEVFLIPEIRDYIKKQILSAGFQISWDGPKTEVVINWRKG